MVLGAKTDAYHEAPATCIICLMSQSSNEAPIQIPAPVAEQTPAPTAMDPMEKAPAGAEQAPSPEPTNQPTTTVPVSIPLPTPPLMPTAPPQSGVATTTQVSILSADDDSDLIEKEWVDRAKQIVERNRDDPYKQSEELTVFKADYMKKRYNKTVKLNK